MFKISEKAEERDRKGTQSAQSSPKRGNKIGTTGPNRTERPLSPKIHRRNHTLKKVIRVKTEASQSPRDDNNHTTNTVHNQPGHSKQPTNPLSQSIDLERLRRLKISQKKAEQKEAIKIEEAILMRVSRRLRGDQSKFAMRSHQKSLLLKAFLGNSLQPPIQNHNNKHIIGQYRPRRRAVDGGSFDADIDQNSNFSLTRPTGRYRFTCTTDSQREKEILRRYRGGEGKIAKGGNFFGGAGLQAKNEETELYNDSVRSFKMGAKVRFKFKRIFVGKNYLKKKLQKRGILRKTKEKTESRAQIRYKKQLEELKRRRQRVAKNFELESSLEKDCLALEVIKMRESVLGGKDAIDKKMYSDIKRRMRRGKVRVKSKTLERSDKPRVSEGDGGFGCDRGINFGLDFGDKHESRPLNVIVRRVGSRGRKVEERGVGSVEGYNNYPKLVRGSGRAIMRGYNSSISLLNLKNQKLMFRNKTFDKPIRGGLGDGSGANQTSREGFGGSFELKPSDGAKGWGRASTKNRASESRKQAKRRLWKILKTRAIQQKN